MFIILSKYETKEGYEEMTPPEKAKRDLNCKLVKERKKETFLHTQEV